MINEQDEDPRNSVFAIMWDCNGLEAVARVPNPADTTFALLKGAEPPRSPNINTWSYFNILCVFHCTIIYLFAKV